MARFDALYHALQVGRRRVYFVAPDDAPGTMADQAVVDRRRMVVLPEDVDVVKVAAAMNPAMSSWVALRRRVPLQPGQSVLVLGATGNAGAAAVQSVSVVVDGSPLGAANSQGLSFSYELDTTQLSDGTHSVGATVTDAAGNTANAPAISINVAN